MEPRGRFLNSKRELTIDVVHGQLISTIYEQSILLPIDDIMAEDLIVSCCNVANGLIGDECQIVNPDVNKWTSMSEGHVSFAILEDYL